MAICILSIITVILILKQFKRNGGDGIISGSKLSIDQKYNQAEEYNSTEMLQEKMPWLNIISARWKQIVLSDYLDGVPGPTDVGTIGLLTLDSDYLKEIHEAYQWYENQNRDIPSSFLTEEMKGYILYSSQEYKESYMPLFKGKNLVFFIDFEKEIVMFSF